MDLDLLHFFIANRISIVLIDIRSVGNVIPIHVDTAMTQGIIAS